MYYVHYLNVGAVVQLFVDKLYQGAPEFLCAANFGKGGLNKEQFEGRRAAKIASTESG